MRSKRISSCFSHIPITAKIIFVVVLFGVTGSCWTSATDMATGRNLRRLRVKVTRTNLSIAVAFHKLRVLRGRWYRDGVPVPYHMMPARIRIDMSYRLIRCLQDHGYANIVRDINAETDFKIVGNYISPRAVWNGWLFYSLLMLAPALIAPIPLYGNDQTHLKVSVYDRTYSRFFSKDTHVRIGLGGISFWALLAADSEQAVADAACVQAIEAIEKYLERRPAFGTMRLPAPVTAPVPPPGPRPVPPPLPAPSPAPLPSPSPSPTQAPPTTPPPAP